MEEAEADNGAAMVVLMEEVAVEMEAWETFQLQLQHKDLAELAVLLTWAAAVEVLLRMATTAAVV